MKNHTRLVLLAACLTAALTLKAQTLLTDFSNSSGWASPGNLVGSSGTFFISGGAANYLVSSPGDSEFVTMSYTGAVGSYTSDWSVRINTAYATPSSIFDTGVQQAINVGLMVTTTGSSLGTSLGNPTFNAFLLNSNLYSNSSNVYSRDIRTSVFVGGQSPVDTETRYAEDSNVTGATVASLLISFDATTKVLTGSYDAAGGTTFTAMTTAGGDTVDVDGTNNWGMTGANTFSIYLVGNSMYDGGATGVGPIITSSEVTLDNLYGSGAISAVPEPSTYAAIAGVLALGLAAWRRQRRVTATA